MFIVIFGLDAHEVTGDWELLLMHSSRRFYADGQKITNLCLHIAGSAKVYCVKSFKTLDEYIDAAVATARFERIEAGRKIYAQIPDFRGVWAQGQTRQEVMKELREVLKGWIELQLERGCELPSVKGARLEELTFA